MPQHVKVVGRSRLEVRLPAGWAPAKELRGDADLELVGSPGRSSMMRPRFVGRVAEGVPATIESASLRYMDELTARSGVYLVTCDVWPQPYWGPGRLIQTAYCVDEGVLARDCYLFLDQGDRITFELTCALPDLLAVEDDVARMVASAARPRLEP